MNYVVNYFNNALRTSFGLNFGGLIPFCINAINNDSNLHCVSSKDTQCNSLYNNKMIHLLTITNLKAIFTLAGNLILEDEVLKVSTFALDSAFG